MSKYTEKFYKTKEWKECRDAYLHHVAGLCERCLKNGEYNGAVIVHHKIYISPKNMLNPNITLNFDNLEALCMSCHNKEHHSNGKVVRYKIDNYGNCIGEEA